MRVTSKLASPSAAALALAAALCAGGQAFADQVIPDDLIVQGSLCVGFDCVNNENFGFDTIILKENNTRILFNDTSVQAGFPANDWRLIANDSANGGANLFAIEDATAARRLLTLSAGAPNNAIFLDSTGRVGFRTSTPVLDLHVSTSNTPAHRLEQTNAGGFTAQTWDIAGNEANFFVRDVTSGSRLPFRIRPGAPTSSIDISADGDVGFNTASPATGIHLRRAADNNNGIMRLEAISTNNAGLTFWTGGDNTMRNWQIANNFQTAGGLSFLRSASNLGNPLTGVMELDVNGNLGLGTPTPSTRLHTTGGVRFQGLPSCANGIVSDANGLLSCSASSRLFKTVTGDLAFNVALTNVMALKPQVGAYKDTPDVPEHWLIAEDVAAVDPALVGLNEGKPYTVKTQNVVADLIVVVQQQQREIEELKRLLSSKR